MIMMEWIMFPTDYRLVYINISLTNYDMFVALITDTTNCQWNDCNYSRLDISSKD